jgi:hypothetical protein
LNTREVFRQLLRMTEQTPCPFQRLPQPCFAHRLQQVIHRASLKGLNGVLVVRRNDNDSRELGPAQLSHQLKASHTGHLQIQQNDVRMLGFNELQRRGPVFRLASNLHALTGLQLLSEDASRYRFIVHDQNAHEISFGAPGV